MRAWTLAILLLAALALGGSGPQPTGFKLSGYDLHAEAPPTEFFALDVYVDAGDDELAAWQVEYSGASMVGNVKLVGVEGGESPAFSPAPHYDPAALAGGRVIIAAYSTDADLPRGETRVARLHLAAPQDAEITHTVNLIAAGNRAGDRLAARVRVARLQSQNDPGHADAPREQGQEP
ncbi:MAG: hypothetical protein R3B57_10425 [Phycisphaerales bacterium]